jgi:acetylglutamate kinase
MQAKLTAATAALAQGIEEVLIAPGAAPQIIAGLFAREQVGTRVVRAAQRVTSHD